MNTEMASASSSPPHGYSFGGKPSVFLSFTDTEPNQNRFITSLYRELNLKGINTIKTIEESRFSIVVLSENYVSSALHLEELVKIVDFWERMGKMVIPIFYNVDPSDLRDQRGRVAEAFMKHEEIFMEDMEKVKRSKDALIKVASICGWDSFQWEETMFIEQIVRDVSDKLIYTSSSNTSDLVGMGSHIMEMEKKLCLESNVVRMVGIWGMGGIGKTTIAKLIYDMLSSQFEVHCFLASVKDNFEKYGGAALLQQLLSKVLMEERSLSARAFNANVNFIKRRLRLKKVLLVLDDVDDWKQLEALAGEPNWFGQGSRVIITARDKHLLDAHGVKCIYEVQYLNTDQALQLFSQHAFKQNNPKVEYLELSKQFASYAKGLPLALMVLGSFLNDRSILEWHNVRHNLATIPDIKIHDVLRISFDGLDDTQKDVFLDIACFFKGENMKFVRDILEACGFFPDIAFAVLKDRALITISDNELLMHDLLQEMVHKIVHQESKGKIGKFTRLWIPDDIYQVLTKCMGTKKVEGIFLDISKVKEMHLSSEAFAKMHNLRLLKFYNNSSKYMRTIHLPDQGLCSISNKLRLFHWECYPSKSLPMSFHAENLVELNLIASNVEKLWSGVQDLVNLKRIDLSYSRSLTRIPDLSKAQNLERLELSTCQSLADVSSSLQHLNKLVYVNLSDCTNLRSLSSGINLKSLKALVLTSCSNFTKLAEISGDVRFLCLSNTSIEELPQSIGSLLSLADLALKNCTRLTKLPNSIVKLTSLSNFSVSGCLNMSEFPEIPENVDSLDLSGTAIEEVPSSICSLSRLLRLDLSNCKRLKSFPSSICNLGCLRALSLSGCINIINFPEFPENIEWLDFSDTAIEEVPSSIFLLSRLFHLNLSNCKRLRSFPSSTCSLECLKTLSLSGCTALQSFHNLKFFPCLQKLDVSNCNLLDFPSNLSDLSSLEDLDLSKNNFESLPASIKHLSQLKLLNVSYCKRLRYLLDIPPRIKVLKACYCTSLATVPRTKSLWELNFEHWDFSNCFGLDQHEVNKVVEDAQYSSLLMSTPSKDNHSSQFCFPGSEIPEWFYNKDVGSSLTVKLLSNGLQLMGIALSVVIGCENTSVVRKVSCKCHFKATTGKHDDFTFISLFESRNDDIILESDNIFMWFKSWKTRPVKTEKWFTEYYEASFEFSTADHSKKLNNVRKCGVHLLYGDETNGNLLDISDKNVSVLNQGSPVPMVHESNNKRGRDDHCYTDGEPCGSGRSHEESSSKRRKIKIFSA